MIPLYKVHIPKNTYLLLKPVLESGFISQGPKAEEFEKAFQGFIGNPNTAMVNSGTSALILALRIAGVGPNTEVITSPMTCLATNIGILELGAKPIWCDIDINTGNIDASKIEKLITNKTKAILFVDWAGIPADLDKINTIAQKYNLKTIEDAAQSLGSTYRGHNTGTLCDFTCFSTQAIKHLTTGDGGAIACKSKEDYERAKLLRWFGLARASTGTNIWEQDVPEYGYKFHQNDINATIGLAQMKYLPKIIKKHKSNGQYLMRKLKGLKNIEIPKVSRYIKPAYWIFTIKCKDKEHRSFVMDKLNSAGIGNALTHVRNDKYSLFSGYERELPALDEFSDRMLNIPCGWWLSKKDLDYIVKTIGEIDES